MKRYNICTKKTYMKGEEEKASWPQVGSLIHFPANGDKREGYKLELHMFPGTQFYVFEQVDRQATRAPEPEKEIDPEEIPY